MKVANALPISFPGRKVSEASRTGDTFEEDRVQLEQRMSLVASGLGSSGIRAIPLTTEETIELLYRSFNIGELESPIHFEGMGEGNRT